MRDFWSDSKFAKWIYGEKPEYNPNGHYDTEGWHKYQEELKRLKPIRYWITEVFLDEFQDIVYLPYDTYRAIKRYITNRFRDKTHVLISTLPKGKWHDMDTRILYANFDSLVWFVEVELATEASEEGETGVDVLNWHCDFKLEGKLMDSSKAFRKVRTIYNWWKFERPIKEKAIEDGWTATTVDREIKTGRLSQLEAELDKEDTKMLCELMKVRRVLWT